MIANVLDVLELKLFNLMNEKKRKKGCGLISMRQLSANEKMK